MIILALGTNLGDRMAHINDAVTALNRIGKVTKVSPIYETEPWGFVSDNGFLNLVVLFESELSPTDLLAATQKIERDLGRKAKTTSEYTDRPIDIDIIGYNNDVINQPDLKIPHPLMQNRNFVLYPLADVAPEWIHPVFGLSAAALKSQSPDKSIPHIKK